MKAATKTKQPAVKVMKDRGTGTIFYVTGPLSEVMRLTREGLGMTREQLAEDAKVCLSTIYRRETDTNMKESGDTSHEASDYERSRTATPGYEGLRWNKIRGLRFRDGR